MLLSTAVEEEEEEEPLDGEFPGCDLEWMREENSEIIVRIERKRIESYENIGQKDMSREIVVYIYWLKVLTNK